MRKRETIDAFSLHATQYTLCRRLETNKRKIQINQSTNNTVNKE